MSAVDRVDRIAVGGRHERPAGSRRRANGDLARVAGRAASLLTALVLVSVLMLGVPAGGSAAVTTYGSPLAVSATLNTAENLAYKGTYTPLPGSVFHTFHSGVDSALWAVAQGGKALSVPVNGQALKFSLKGCAVPAASGPAPLTQIHFQVLSPRPGGGAQVNLTSQPFEIPVCGVGGASGATVSSYEPVNMCVSPGDYLDFNDEGGYVENVYRAGVPYKVIGAVKGSTMDSFLKSDGTGNGAVFSPSETSATEGFASNQNEELLMQVQLGTGPNARYVCPGGTKEAPPVLPVIHIHPQTDGLNHAGVVQIAIYCRPSGGCPGTATMTARSVAGVVGRASFDLRGDTTSRVAIKISPGLQALIRAHHAAAATFTATVDGHKFTQTIEVKIF
jgi:hypothetical protein